MKRSILATLQLLERSGIPYCVLHGGERLDEESASDVDLAIRPQDLNRAEQVLHSQQRPCCVQLLQHQSTAFYFVLAAADGEKPRFVRLDLATDYRRDGRRLLSAGELLSGRRRALGIWVASLAAEYCYLLAKKVAKGAAPAAQWRRLRVLARRLGPQAGTLASRILGQQRARQVLLWLEREDWGAIEGNLPALRKSLRAAALRRNPAAGLRYWLPELGRIWRRLRHPAGLFVAVLGPDGSGKSTLLRRLPALLGPPFRRSDAFHLRPGLFPAVGGGRPANDPHGQPPRGVLASALKLFYLIGDCCLGYLLRVRPRLVRSSLVLFDRYLPDLLADPRRYRHGGSAWLVRQACRLVPQPDLFLVLDVPVPKLRKRKREVTFAEARRQSRAYRSLAAELPNAVLLSGVKGEEALAAEAARAILARLRWRYGRRRRLWFRSSGSAAWSGLGGFAVAGSGREAGRQARAEPSGRQRYWRLALRDGRGFILPLQPPRIAAAALELYGAQKPRARVAKSCLAAGLVTGLLQPLLPRLKAGEGEVGREPALQNFLQEILGRRDLYFAACLGTPGAHRKPVIQVMEGSGRTLAYAKIGWNRTTCELLENEAQALRRMAGGSCQHLSVPALLHLGRWQGRLVLLESSPPPQATAAGRSLDPGYLGVLGELATLDPQRLQLGESLFWRSLESQSARTDGALLGGDLGALLGRIPLRLRETVFPFCSCHGDFVPWNARRVDGRLFLFDWEYARTCWPAGYDLFHFLLQTRLLLTGRPPLRIFREVLEQVSRQEVMSTYWRRLGIRQRSILALMVIFLLERATYHARMNPGPYPLLRRILVLVDIGCRELGWLP